MPKKKKSFWEGKFFQAIEKKAPDVAGTLLKTAGDLTGIELLNKAGELIDGPEAAELTPEDKVQLLKLQRIERDELRIHAEDRASARNREIEFVKAVGRDWFMYVVGAVILGLLVYTIWYVLNHELHNSEIAHLLIGEITGMALGIVVYYFGSSRGSKDKQKAIDKLMEK